MLVTRQGISCTMDRRKLVRWIKMKKKEHIVKTVKPGSIAEELEIAPGDKVLAIDNTEIEDIFDYQFLTQDTYIELLV